MLDDLRDDADFVEEDDQLDYEYENASAGRCPNRLFRYDP